MKKSILIGALAALMLFAFVACDGSTNVNGAVTYLEATQTETYVKGEYATADGFSYIGYTNMGTTVTIDPSSIVMTPTALSNATTSVGFSYLDVKGSVIVEAEDVTAITVDATEAKPEYYAVVDSYDYGAEATARKTISDEGIVLTIAYDGGEKVVAAEDLSGVVLSGVDDSDWTISDGIAKEYTVTVAFQGMKDDFKITMKPNYVDSVDMKVSEGFELFSDSKTKNSLKYDANGADGIYMELTYQGGEVKNAAADKVKYQNELDPSKYDWALTNYQFVSGGAGSFHIVGYYTGNDCKEGIVRTDSIDISYEKIAIESVEVNPARSIKAGDYSLSTNPPYTAGTLTATVTYTDGSTATPAKTLVYRATDNAATVTDDYYTLSVPNLSTYAADERYTLTISGVAAGKEFSITDSFLITK